MQETLNDLYNQYLQVEPIKNNLNIVRQRIRQLQNLKIIKEPIKKSDKTQPSDEQETYLLELKSQFVLIKDLRKKVSERLFNKIKKQLDKKNENTDSYSRIVNSKTRNYLQTALLRQNQIAKLHTSIGETQEILENIRIICCNTNYDHINPEIELLNNEIQACKWLLSLMTHDLHNVNSKLN